MFACLVFGADFILFRKRLTPSQTYHTLHTKTNHNSSRALVFPSPFLSPTPLSFPLDLPKCPSIVRERQGETGHTRPIRSIYCADYPRLRLLPVSRQGAYTTGIAYLVCPCSISRIPLIRRPVYVGRARFCSAV